MRHPIRNLLLGAALAATPALAAAQAVPVAGLVELSGSGATAGTGFNNGVKLAIREINAAGGLNGRKIDYNAFDTQTNPGVAKGLAQRAIDDKAYVILGPVFSGSILVSMQETRRAEVPNIVGGEAAAITQQGNPYVFRSSFTQASAMPKVVRYMTEFLKAKSVAVMFANTDFGKGGRDVVVKELEAAGVKVVADISTDVPQVDFSGPVLRAKQANADVLFVYLHEEESARALRELRKQGYDKPIVGETTLANEKVVELAGEAANGIVAHVGLTGEAPNATVQAFAKKYEAEYKARPDHNAMKGYTAAWAMKAVQDKLGRFDQKAFAKTLHGAQFSAKDYPGLLFDVRYDDKGDLDRESFIVKIVNGRSQVIETLRPALSLKIAMHSIAFIAWTARRAGAMIVGRGVRPREG